MASKSKLKSTKEEPCFDTQIISRCHNSLCKTCRKHTSCLQKPREGVCTSFEKGPAWDHICPGDPNSFFEETASEEAYSA